MTNKRLLLINGPNLNMLGKREPGIYGSLTLEEIEATAVAHAKSKGFKLRAFQSNSEGALVTAIQEALTDCDGVLINAGAYTHTSVALHDALRAAGLPYVELHISNVFAREDFRHHSYLSQHAIGVIAGLGMGSYTAAIDALAAKLA